MRRVVSSSQIVGTCEWRGQMIDVSAHSDAYYDETAGKLEAKLSAAAEPADIEFHPEWSKPDWLPAKQTVEEHLAYEEALPAAKAIFRNWSRKVREAIPVRTVTNQR
ncbi:MAG: hypothetical protein ACO1QS_13030 [Verrucomicrobiota bacterium]